MPGRLGTSYLDGQLSYSQLSEGRVVSSPDPPPGTHFIFSTPVEQVFPTVDSGLAHAMRIPYWPDHIWSMQELSGNLSDSVGSSDLSPINSPLQGQQAPGIWNGGEYTARKAVEFLEGTSAAWQSSDSSVMDPGSGKSMSLLVFFRMSSLPTTTRYLAGKHNPSTGWLLGTNSSGHIVATISDGVTGLSATVTEDHADGALHYAYLVINRTANTISVVTDLGSASQDISTVGDAANAVAIAFGTLYASSSFPGQITYAAAWDNSTAAEAITSSDVAYLWKQASDPTGLLTTQTRTSPISVPVGPENVAHFSKNTVPIGYTSSAVNTRKLALFANTSTTNLIKWSEDFSNAVWTKSTMSVNSNFSDSPDGFRSADKLTAGADNDQIVQTFTTTAATKYTVSVWVKEVTPGVTGRVVFYDETGAAELASEVFTADDTWTQRIEVVATTNGGQVSSSIRIEIDTDTEELLVWGADVRAGDLLGDYIRTNSSIVSTAIPDFRSANVVPSRLARVEAQVILATDQNTGQIIFSTENTSDWRVLWHPTGRTTQFRYHNGAAASWAIMTGGAISLGVSRKYIARWDIDDAGNFPEDPDRSGSGHLDGVTQGTPVTTSSTLSEELRDLRIGVNYNSTGGLQGWIEFISIYDTVGAEPTA